MALCKIVAGSGGGGSALTSQIIQGGLSTGWSALPNSGTITLDGIATVVLINNYGGMKWRNTTKGTSGDFTDAPAYGSDGCGFATFEVSKGDIVQFNSNSSRTIYCIMSVVGTS